MQASLATKKKKTPQLKYTKRVCFSHYFYVLILQIITTYIYKINASLYPCKNVS